MMKKKKTTKYKIDLETCVGCYHCVHHSDGATEMRKLPVKKEYKAFVIDQIKLKKAGGCKLCPWGAIQIDV